MKEIAVIIPNYNGFRYSERCFRSLEAQTFTDFCVCVVDDCSADDSFERLSEYAKNSPLDIQILKTETNKGPGNARKVGLANTQSRFVAFCDIDDWYDRDFLEVQRAHAVENDADLVMCNHRFVNNEGTVQKADATTWAEECLPPKKQVLANARMSLCRLLIRRQLFDEVILPEIYYGEDAPVTLQLIRNANRVYVDREARYNYLVRSNSASGTVKERAVGDFETAFRVIFDCLYSSYRDECEYIGINTVLYGITLIQLKLGKPGKSVLETVKTFENNFPDWADNIYFGKLGKSKKIYLWAIRHRITVLCRLYAFLHTRLLRHYAKV